MQEMIHDRPNPYTYVKYDAEIAAEQEAFKKEFEALTVKVITQVAPGRHQSLCLTHLEEAYMWIGKALRDKQIAKSDAPHEPARG